MAFVKKTWKDRISQYPNRRTITDENGVTKPVTVGRDEGEVTQEGDAFSASNMNELEQRIYTAFQQGGGGGGGGGSAATTTFDDTNVAYEADNVQEALEKVTKSLTYAEYEALTEEEKNNGTIYLITDINGTGDKFQPVIYSEEEREVGVWTNGKPIYQKTLTCTTTTVIGPNDWATIPWNSEPSDIEFLVAGQVHEGDVPNTYATVRAAYTGGHIKLAALYSSDFSANSKFTFWYTKTTDTAGSGTWTPQGVPAVHYSTDERVVGTWTDGSTLYQKTYSYSISSETSQEIATLDSNIVVKEIKGIIHNNGTDMNIPWIDTSFFYNIYISSAHKLTAIKRNTGDWTSQTVEITLLYTKSST